MTTFVTIFDRSNNVRRFFDAASLNLASLRWLTLLYMEGTVLFLSMIPGIG